MNTPHYIKAGWLFEGSGGPAKKNMLLTVENGIFTSLGPCRGDSVPSPGAITDLSCCTILPPLVDCHAHLSMSGATDPQVRQRQLTAQYDEARHCIAANIHYHFSHGVFAVRDGGDALGHSLRFKSEPAAMTREPVLVNVAGRAWHKRGRYGRVMGRHPQDHETLSDAFAQDRDAIDHVKIINSGINSLSVFGKKTAPQFTLDELKEVVTLAHRRGCKVMVHANGRLPVQMALEAGCDSIEHGFFMGRENLRRMVDMGTVWVPTVCTMKTLGEGGSLSAPDINKGVVEKNLHHQLGQLARAREYGVRVAVGTDAGSWGVIHGESMVEELELFLEAGYSLAEALECASANGAQLLGIDTIGSIAVGKPANFIAARATPEMMPRNLSDLQGIYLAGKPYAKELL